MVSVETDHIARQHKFGDFKKVKKKTANLGYLRHKRGVLNITHLPIKKVC